jgi:nucleoside 2-deoxyribosyltransferase
VVKLYFAARFKRAEELRQYKKLLEATGMYQVTSSWLAGTDGSEKDHDIASDEEKKSYAIRDVQDIDRADALVYFSPSGRHGGCHVELGIALAAQKEVILVGPGENVFHWLPNIQHFQTPADFIAALGANSADNTELYPGERRA